MVSASRALGALFLLVTAGTASAADETEEEVTDMEFLEYLGSWDGSDEDWLLFDEPAAAETDKERSDETHRDDPETDDEG